MPIALDFFKGGVKWNMTLNVRLIDKGGYYMKGFKKLTAGLLGVVMALGVCSFTALAEDSITSESNGGAYQVGDNTYDTLDEAYNHIGNDSDRTIKLVGPVKELDIEGKEDLIVDGNGQTVGSVQFLGNNETVTLQNVRFIQEGGFAIDVNDTNNNDTNNKDITITGCRFEVKEDANAPWVAIYVQKIVDGLNIEGNAFVLDRIPNNKSFQCIGFAYTEDMRAYNILIKDNTVTASHTEGSAYFIIGGYEALGGEYGITDMEISDNNIESTDKGDLCGTWLANTNGLEVTGNIFDCEVGVALSTGEGAPSKNVIIRDNDGNTESMVWLYGDNPVEEGFDTDVDGNNILIDGGAESSVIKVTFDANGGDCDVNTKILVLTGDGSAKVGELPAPSRNGYHFDGWFTENGKRVSDNTTFSENTTLYAKWTDDSSRHSYSLSEGRVDRDDEEEPVVTPEEPTEEGPFSDVGKDNPNYDAIVEVYEKGWMAGIADGVFAPNGTLTRGMAVTILWNRAGQPEPASVAPFLDVTSDAWYAKAVAWAYENGITSGYGDTYGPDDFLTTEQFTRMNDIANGRTPEVYVGGAPYATRGWVAGMLVME